MADDDEKSGPESDPWADIESGTTPDLTDGFAFSFEEQVDSPADAGAADSPVEGVDDELVDAWLADGESAARAVEQPAGAPVDEPPRPLGVFDPDGTDMTHHGIPGSGEEVVAASSRIGTGFSGIDPRREIDPPAPTDESDAVEWLESSGVDDGEETAPADRDAAMFVEQGGETTDDGGSSGAGATVDVIEFATAAAGTAGAEAAVAAGRKPDGFGRLAGILLGGLAAIPVALGILMWGLQQDPLGVARRVPDSLSFLVPAGLRAVPVPVVASLSEPGVGSPVQPAAPPVAAEVPPLPEEPQTPVSPPVEPVADGLAVAVPEEPPTVAATTTAADAAPIGGDTAAAVEPPAPVEAIEDTLNDPPSAPVPDDAAALAASAPPEADAVTAAPPDGGTPVADPPTDAPRPTDVAVSDLFAVDPPPASPPLDASPKAVLAAVPTPPIVPLDTNAFARAVADASAARMAVDAFTDSADPARKPLLVRWYKSLARLGEELAELERAAADGGSTLAETLAASAGLRAGLDVANDGGDELARLALDWLAYPRRPSAGIVMPATVVGVRRAGPLWAARCTLSDAAGRSRDVAVICRDEPGAAVGDAVVVTGVVLDDGVVWAADMRLAVGSTPAP